MLVEAPVSRRERDRQHEDRVQRDRDYRAAKAAREAQRLAKQAERLARRQGR